MVQTEVRAGWSTGGRGCEEQILTTRLLIDISRKCKLALWVAFIDYKKAYDMVDRRTLLQLLDEKGCGTTFLKAVGASLVHSMGMVGGETFSTFTGVRQGASSSCPLFTFFIDSTIEAIASFGPDGWLGNLHTLLFMDDSHFRHIQRKSSQEAVLTEGMHRQAWNGNPPIQISIYDSQRYRHATVRTR